MGYCPFILKEKKMNINVFIENMQQKPVSFTKEELVLDSLSITQINRLLRAKIEEIRFRCSFTRSIRSSQYYLVWFHSPHEAASEIIPGAYFFDFTIKIPDVLELKRIVLGCGVSSADYVTYAVELENFFRREVFRARRRLHRYQRQLENLHDLGDVPIPVLRMVHARIAKKYREQKKQAELSCSYSEESIHRQIARELATQLRLLNAYLM